MPGDVIAGAGGHDAQRHARRGDDVYPQVNHAVPADDDQCLNVPVRPVAQEGPSCATRLLVGAATDMKDLMAGLGENPEGNIVGGRMTASARGGVGQQSDTHRRKSKDKSGENEQARLATRPGRPRARRRAQRAFSPPVCHA